MNSNNNHYPQARELAVYTVLGGGMVEKLRRRGAGGVGGGVVGFAMGEVDGSVTSGRGEAYGYLVCFLLTCWRKSRN